LVILVAVNFSSTSTVRDAKQMLVVSSVIMAICIAAGIHELLKLAAQSVSTGMVDFHRITPYPALPAVMGLVGGATATWWLIYAIIAFGSIPLVVAANLSILGFLQCAFALFVNGLVIQTLAICTAFREHSAQTNRFGLLAIGSFFLLPLFFGATKVRAVELLLPISHLTVLSLFNDFFNNLIIPTDFLGLSLPSFFAFLVIQGVFLGIFAKIAARNFQETLVPALSKRVLLVLFLYLTFIGITSLFPLLIDAGIRKSAVYIASLSACCTGTVLLFFAAPSRLCFLRSLGHQTSNNQITKLFQNHIPVGKMALVLSAITLFTAAVIEWRAAMIAGVSIDLYMSRLDGRVALGACLCMVQSAIYWQLIRFRWPSQEKFYFVFAKIVFWGLPLLFAMLISFGGSRDLSKLMAALSPLFLVAPFAEQQLEHFLVSFGLNTALTMVGLFLLQRELKAIQAQVTDTSRKSGK